MQENEFCRGAKHRNLILMYISWLTLSLAPTIVAPPEREFARGQPEMQQAMDNMVTYGSMIMKRVDAASKDNTDHPEMLSSKTTNLLEKTVLMLSSLPESKERKWLENFVERMRAISVMLQKTADSKMENNSVSDAPIPEGVPITPTWPTMTAVPEAIPFQKSSKMMPKFPVTSPEVSQVLPDNEYSTERHPATKPAVVMEKDDDELVRELESLHQEFAMHVPEQKSKVNEQVPVVTTLSTPLFPEVRNKKLVNVEEEKEKLKEKLFQEIAELQRLGGSISRDIMDGLNKDNQKEAGLTTNQNTENEYNLKFTEAHMGDGQAIQPLKEFKGENKEISNNNLQNQDLEKITSYQNGKLLQHENLNHSAQNFHPNFNFNPQILSKEMRNFQHMPPQSKEQSYLTGFQNAMHGFQNPNPYNSNEQYHAMLHYSNQQPGHIPDALKQMLSKPHNTIYNQNLIASRYNRFLMKNGYGPYPYMQNWNHKSSTNHPPLMMPTYQIKQPVNHQMDVQLSDEMKRQLRDGKIIVLSDSVVRSNFEPCKDAEKKENKPNKPSSEIEEKKNDTIISN